MVNDTELKSLYAGSKIQGFRAPRLEINDEGLNALKAINYLYDQDLEELGGRDLLHADEDVSQAVLAARERLQLLMHALGGVPPELLLVLLARVAEAPEAERAELGRVLGVVRAPGGGNGVELTQAIPAIRRIRLSRSVVGRHKNSMTE